MTIKYLINMREKLFDQSFYVIKVIVGSSIPVWKITHHQQLSQTGCEIPLVRMYDIVAKTIQNVTRMKDCCDIYIVCVSKLYVFGILLELASQNKQLCPNITGLIFFCETKKKSHTLL